MLKKQFFFGASFLISAALYASYQQDIGENSSRDFVRSISYGGHSANYGGHGVTHDHSAGY